MKSIITPTASNFVISIFYVILSYISSVLSVPSCGLYGAPPCQFLPAPPGQTPSCARPGKTYCEHVDNYPTYLIKHLVHKWGYEAKNLIVDETFEDFAAAFWPDTPPVFYDPAFIFPNKHSYASYPHNSFTHNYQHAKHTNDLVGYSYDTPVSSVTANGAPAPNAYNPVIRHHNHQETPAFLLYNSAARKNQFGGYLDGLKITPNNHNNHNNNNAGYWLKRVARDTSPPVVDLNVTQSADSSRDVSINMDLLDIVGVSRQENSHKVRTKRQSPGRNILCQTTTQFITPQAALNNKGSWMFVVNEANTARQMVKAELCASNTCSNLCQLPNGYNSRCEQKFVQKRLIALQGNGQNLYTDTFWFPSCCVCTIAAN